MSEQAPISTISVDIDAYKRNVRLRVLRAESGLEQAGAYETLVAVSSSGEGFHVVGYFDEHVPQEAQFRIRENLNDDPNRLRMDRQRAERGLPIGTMWTHKGGNEGVRAEYDTAGAALQHVEVTARTDYERVKGLQNRGRKEIQDLEIPHTANISGQMT